MDLIWPYENRDGYLYIDGVSSLELARKYGTPLYVYSEELIRKQYRRLKAAISQHCRNHIILYAAKANTNLSVLRVLREEGAHIDAVSPGELYSALKAGFKPEQILFTGTSVGLEELLYIIENDVRINIDSESQLDRLLEFEVPEFISVRINPEIGAGHHDHVITAGPLAKFGVWEEDAVKVYRKAHSRGIERFGIQMHIGSLITDVDNYLKASDRLLQIASHVEKEVGISFDFIDLGGGLPVSYKPEDKPIDLDRFISTFLGFVLKKIVNYELGEPLIYFEPGRFLVAEAGVLLTRVTTVKRTPGKTWVGVDAGFNTLVRPIMYGSYHHIISASAMNEPEEKFDIYGPLCESGDIFARDRALPRVKEGALLGIMNAGAYGFSMASRYNTRPLPAEVMVSNGVEKLARERETLDDLLRGQK